MKNLVTNLLIIFLLIILVFFAFSYYNKKQLESLTTKKIKILTSVGAIAGLTKELVKECGEVINLRLPRNIQNFKLLPSDLNLTKNVDLVLKVNYGLDDCLEKVIDDKNKIVAANKNVILLSSDKNKINSHYWLLTDNLPIILKNIYLKLVEINPEETLYYFNNYQKAIKKVKAIQERLKYYQKETKNKKVVATRKTVAYLAKDLDLNMIGYLKTEKGEDIPLDDLYRLIKEIKKYHVKYLIAEKDYSDPYVEQIAKLYDLKIIFIDPLESFSKQESFFDIFSKNLENIYNEIK